MSVILESGASRHGGRTSQGKSPGADHVITSCSNTAAVQARSSAAEIAATVCWFCSGNFRLIILFPIRSRFVSDLFRGCPSIVFCGR